MVSALFELIETAGFTALGWFAPRREDAVPDIAPGRPTQGLILIGNAGPGMWTRFSAECPNGDHPLDQWTRAAVGQLIAEIGQDTRAVFPFDQPYQPFQRWAKASGIGFVSPLGLTIHPVYGLWHAYRAALLFSDVLDLPAISPHEHPCEGCPGQPCLKTCPVNAFTVSGYRLEACVEHLHTSAGRSCSGGCLARHACPVGRTYAYQPDQAHFHMRHFLKAHS
ncbi:hypothetical protein [Rhodoligotrophos ferricapiens]|uniref:hypothetical protein n=1 Tax=Rhodoligotrophos ferricapiens TaxID=3069264 RepID=UPI00315CEC7F